MKIDKLIKELQELREAAKGDIEINIIQRGTWPGAPFPRILIFHEIQGWDINHADKKVSVHLELSEKPLKVTFPFQPGGK